MTSAKEVTLRDVITTADREADYVARGLWNDVSLVDRLEAHVHARPEATAVVDGPVRASYSQLDRDANRVAGFLRGVGVEVGDVVALQLPNWYTSVAVAMGALKAGAVVNPMLPLYRERELRHMLGVGRTKVIFTPNIYRDFNHEKRIASLRPDLPALSHHVTVGRESEWLDEMFGIPPAVTPKASIGAGAVCELIFTSGTEADPKAIMHTERTLNANARATWDALRMTGADVIWMPAPIGHSTGFNHGFRLAVYHGLPLVLQDRWDAAEGIRLIENEKCTHTLLSTTFLRDLTRAAQQQRCDVSSMRLFGCGGAPVPPEEVVAADAVGIGCLRLYGATEFLVATWNRPNASKHSRSYTEGLPLAGVELEVRGADGKPVVGKQGDVFVRSPSGSVGFFDDPVRTAAAYTPDGWIRSGDVGIVDVEGCFTISGRVKEIIIRGGLNIAPREIEDLILQIPGIRSAAVVGLPDSRLGEITCAFVVLEPGLVIALEDVVEALRSAGLATYKLPQRLEVVAEMPTTATGKIRKHVLIASLAASPTDGSNEGSG